jgi:tRNA (guanine37-N1)-methyltransferase
VPEVLLSGDHGAVDRWRLEQAQARTKAARPDLIERSMYTPPPDPKNRKRSVRARPKSK